MGAVSNSLASSFQSFVKIQRNAEVDQIIVKNGKAAGVALSNGDEIYANGHLEPRSKNI